MELVKFAVIIKFDTDVLSLLSVKKHYSNSWVSCHRHNAQICLLPVLAYSLLYYFVANMVASTVKLCFSWNNDLLCEWMQSLPALM